MKKKWYIWINPSSETIELCIILYVSLLMRTLSTSFCTLSQYMPKMRLASTRNSTLHWFLQILPGALANYLDFSKCLRLLQKKWKLSPICFNNEKTGCYISCFKRHLYRCVKAFAAFCSECFWRPDQMYFVFDLISFILFAPTKCHYTSLGQICCNRKKVERSFIIGK